ncbi:ABC transporter ATP-binding protein [Micromonospora sp. URMC 106]|uniref:ABC transporter ATP-binding protein n=1 Tax=Micromonospora sp. URMC 106 TaxID=3423408 RepID=UPI003F1D9F1F
MASLISSNLPRDAAQDPLRVVGLTKSYGPAGQVVALAGVTASFAAATFTAVMGPSGSGKTTFLQCASGLDRPTAGTVFVDGREFPYGSEAAATRFRRTRIGFVFQQYNLLPTLTALQNVMLPMRLAGRPVQRRQCLALLDQVGLGGHADRRPSELSGGQQQRVAIARALASRPSIVFADEPTGALDSASASAVLALLRRAVDDHGQTVVMVTHDPIAAGFADSVVFLADGRIVGTLQAPTAAAVSEQMVRLDAGRRSGGPR